MKINFSSILKILIIPFFVLTVLSGCREYRCNNGVYVYNTYECWNNGGLGYYSTQLRKSRKKYSNYSGKWNFTGKMSSATCPYLNKNTASSFSILDRGNGNITIRNLGVFGSYNLKLIKRRSRMSIKRKYLFLNITGNANVSFNAAKNNGSINGTAYVSSFNQSQCKVTLRGTLRR